MMPSFRQKFVGFIRQLSNTSDTARDNEVPDNASDCFIQNYLKGSEKVNKNEPVILHGKKPYEIPPLDIGDFDVSDIRAADTGPDGGLMTVNKKEDQNANNNIIAGVDNWMNPHARAYGKSCSLYEVHPVTQLRAGDPIADCYGLLVREDSALLCLADGVNWGVKASVAAKAAVHGCIDYLNQHIFCSASPKPTTTTEVFSSLLRSFHAAHSLILQEKGMLTTLTAVVVLPLASDTCHGTRQYVVCTCNVGDSLAYVFSPKYGVREITQGSHDVHQMRDMRDALGALGPVDGQNPELSNLTLSLTQVEDGDIVFLTSDGVSDNLDPVVGKFTGLPTVEAHQRHKLLLLRTEDLLRYGVSGKGPPVSSAEDLVTLLLDFVSRLTGAKRGILEDRDLYTTGTGTTGTGTTGTPGTVMTQGQQISRRRRELCKRMHAIPGKLDHASVAAYVVGRMRENGERKERKESEEMGEGESRAEDAERRLAEEKGESVRKGDEKVEKTEDERALGNVSERIDDVKQETREKDKESLETGKEIEKSRCRRNREETKKERGNIENEEERDGEKKEAKERGSFEDGEREERDRERQRVQLRETRNSIEESNDCERIVERGGGRVSEKQEVFSEGVNLNEGLDQFENIDDDDEDVLSEENASIPGEKTGADIKEIDEREDDLRSARDGRETSVNNVNVQQFVQKESNGESENTSKVNTNGVKVSHKKSPERVTSKVASNDRRGKDDRNRAGSKRNDGLNTKDRTGSKHSSSRNKDGGSSRRKDVSKVHK